MSKDVYDRYLHYINFPFQTWTGYNVFVNFHNPLMILLLWYRVSQLKPPTIPNIASHLRCISPTQTQVILLHHSSIQTLTST